MRAIASEWNVSLGTIQRSVATGVSQGWLEARRGAGVWTRGTRPETPPASRRMDAEGLVAEITAAIQKGSLAAGHPLPAPKDQAARQGTHPATVRKAYALLTARGLVERTGRTWTVSRPRLQRSPRPRIVLCIGAPDAAGRLRMDSDPEWDFWREIQAEVIRHGLDPRVLAWTGSLPEHRGEAIGAIVSNWHLFDSVPLLDGLLRLRIPSSVWVANYEILPGKRYRGTRSLWFHDLANGRGAGRTMAAYLSRLDHRRVAWISPFHGSPWSRNRLAGFRQALPDGIDLVEICHDAWTSEWDVQQHVMGAPDVLERLRLDDIGLEAERRDLAWPLVEAVTRDRCLETFAPRLEEALRSGATLWVAASDLIARWCLHWLHARGLAVPRDLAIASFDDTRDATHLDLTSLRFDVQEMARAMVRQILSSRQEHRAVTSYSGRVVERTSTAGFAV